VTTGHPNIFLLEHHRLVIQKGRKRFWIQHADSLSVRTSESNGSPAEDAIRSALNEVQTRLSHWENALETGELSIEHAAQRIKELHEQRQELLKKKQALDQNRRGVAKISAIPTAQMDRYVAEIRRRLVEKRIGAKREFIQEVLKEVRVRGSNVTLTYKLPLMASQCRFFTLLSLVATYTEKP